MATASVVFTGQQTTTGAAAPLSSQALSNSVTVQALPGNSGVVTVGGYGVTAGTGYPLAAGSTITLTAVNTSVINILGNGTDKVAWMGN
jgi:hypothetical protein